MKAVNPHLHLRRLRVGLALSALVIGGLAGITCAHQTDRSESVPLKVTSACGDYCDRRAECDDEVEAAKRRNRCVDVMTDCQADEQNRALNDLTGCAKESCDDVGTCAIGAGSHCFLGL